MPQKKAYMDLYETLRNDIISGKYLPGARLPSKRALADLYNVAIITVEHAYNMLCDEGYVEAKQRSGYFCAFQRDSMLSPPSPAVQNPIYWNNTHASEEQLPVTVFTKLMRATLSKYDSRMMVKSPNYGTRELRTAISSYLFRARNIHADPSHIIIGSGSEYFYSMIVMLLGRECIYGIEDPSYEKIRRVYAANGARVAPLRLGSDGIRSEELQATNASHLHVTPFHSFPSGISASVSKRMEYLKWARDRNGYIIEDDYDSEFTMLSKPEDTIFSLDGQSHVIYMNSFSRTVASSLRVAYMLLPETLSERFRNELGFFSCSVPVLEQLFLAELLNSGEFERHINRIRRKRRQQEKATD